MIVQFPFVVTAINNGYSAMSGRSRVRPSMAAVRRLPVATPGNRVEREDFKRDGRCLPPTGYEPHSVYIGVLEGPE